MNRRRPKISAHRRAASPEAPEELPELPSTEASNVVESRGNCENKADEEEADWGDECDEGGDDLGIENEGGLGVDEKNVPNLADCFGDMAREDANANNEDDNSGDDVWNDDFIPESFPASDDEVDSDDECNRNGELLWLGQTFISASDFKRGLLMYALKTEYDIKMYKSESQRFGAKCSDVQCPWRIYCSYERGKNKLMVKVYINKHVCVRSGHCKVLKIASIKQLFEERLRRNPKMTPKEMVEEVKLKFNLSVSKDQCKKVKAHLGRQRRASHETQFARIWDYQTKIIASNPGSTMDIETIPRPPGGLQRFYRLYVCFKKVRDAWKQCCRPIIGVDGTFLKWDIKGVLLIVVGRDGDNRIFPIA